MRGVVQYIARGAYETCIKDMVDGEVCLWWAEVLLIIVGACLAVVGVTFCILDVFQSESYFLAEVLLLGSGLICLIVGFYLRGRFGLPDIPPPPM